MNLRALRKRAGLIIRNVARELKCSESSIRNWEKGRTTPMMEVWQLRLPVFLKRGFLNPLGFAWLTIFDFLDSLRNTDRIAPRKTDNSCFRQRLLTRNLILIIPA
jgi:transcriptional regulator with XRE-family HTH domain